MQTAEALRQAADPELLAALVAAFPSPEAIEPRRYFANEWALEKIPSLEGDLDRRLEILSTRREAALAKLEKDLDRYTDLLTRKLDALSDYDITIAYGGKPLEALYGALKFKIAHASYQLSMGHALTVAIAETMAVIERARPQLDLF